MPKPGPRTVYRYTAEFKATAVRLSQIPGVLVCDVADSLAIQGEPDDRVTPHPLYLALGLDDASREAAYRERFRYELDPVLVDVIRRATNGNYALGSGTFAAQVAAALGRRAVPGKPGRPGRGGEPESGSLF